LQSSFTQEEEEEEEEEDCWRNCRHLICERIADSLRTWKAFVHYAQQQQQPSSISLQQSTRNLQALENWREQHFAHSNIRTQELARSTLLFAICFCEHYYRGRL
jgi:hypothetical protein